MPRKAREWTALEVKNARHSGGAASDRRPVGGVPGLYLQISPTGSKSWTLRYLAGNKRRELGLGAYPEIGLAQARDRAREVRDQIWHGLDPVQERSKRRAELAVERARAMTFADAVERYLAATLDQFRNEKHRAQWRSTLETYAVPTLGALPVADVTVQDVLRALEPIWRDKTETASRVRGRIEAVLAWATVSGYRTGDNPAAWRNNLDKVLPAPSAVKKAKAGGREGRQPALAIDDAPRWYAALRQRDGMAALALAFQALTASRSGAVRLATWDEFDLDAGLWTIQPGRGASKITKTAHRVPLTPAMLDLLREAEAGRRSDIVFPAARGGALSDMSLSKSMKTVHKLDLKAGGAGFICPTTGRPAVPHGLRSTFRDWAAERTSYPGDMAEIALAHTVGSAVERAYRRGDMLEKRRAMMRDWGGFLTGWNVVSIAGKRNI
jgi:integrase